MDGHSGSTLLVAAVLETKIIEAFFALVVSTFFFRLVKPMNTKPW